MRQDAVVPDEAGTFQSPSVFGATATRTSGSANQFAGTDKDAVPDRLHGDSTGQCANRVHNVSKHNLEVTP
jgi:hypothetical protein